jgi:uncharacterized protein YggE
MRHIVALMLCLIPFSIHAEPQISGTPSELGKFLEPEAPTVTLVGEGKLQLQADRAIVRVLVTTENKLLSEALKKNETLRRGLTQALTNAGLSADRILSSRFSSVPEQSNWSEKVRSYRISHQMKITIDNGQQFSALAQFIDQTPEMRMQELEPDHSAKDEQYTKVLQEAFKNVEKKKELYEKALGQKLTPKTAREASAQATANRVAQQNQYASSDGFLSSGLRSPKMVTAIPGSSEISGLDINSTGFFGELSYRVVVSVDYSVGKPAKLTSQ